MTSSVLVVGAAGFIGRAITRALLERNTSVRACLRRSALSTALADDSRVSVLRGGITAETELKGTSAIIDAAHGDRSSEVRLAALLDAASRQGTRCVVYISSIEVYGAKQGDISESDEPVPPLGAYGAIKLADEVRLADWARAEPSRLAVALRAGAVYGPRSYFWIDKMLARIRSGAWGEFGRRGEGTASLIHVDDLAAAAANAALLPTTGWLPLNIVGDDCPTWNAYFRLVAECSGLPLDKMTPMSLGLRVAASYPAKVWRQLGGSGFEAVALAPTPGELRTFARTARYRTDEARARLGWQPQRHLEEAVRVAVEEAMHHG
jgi:UDP-glucose 4-epimerase